MNFESIEDIKRQDFVGFVSVSFLRESACRQIPEIPGIYLVLRLQPEPPVFLEQNPGGHFKGRNPTVSIQEMRQAWVPDSLVIYIGKASALRKRLSNYMRFGEGKPASHWGGRYVWQLADAASLLVCWKETPNEDPRLAESELIQEFSARYDKRPFANLKD
jgi:hypothetical protein